MKLNGCELVAGTPDGDCDDTYTYDDAGRRTAAATTTIDITYGWNEAGWLTGFAQDNGTTDVDATLVRDGDGALVGVESTVGGGSPTTTELIWDDTGGLAQIAESDFGTGDASFQIGNRRIQQQGDFYAYDHLGSTVRSAASSTGPNDYEAFGEPDTDNDWPIYFGYRGELTLGLPESPLVHLRARDYDPTTGTFLTKDPLDGVDGTTTVANPYHYTDNDPLNKVDPLGLRPEDDGPPFEQEEPEDPTPDIEPECDAFAMFEGLNIEDAMRGRGGWPCGFKKKFDYVPEVRLDTKAAPRMYANPLPDADCSGDFAKTIVLGPLIAGEADKNFEDACDSHDFAYDLLRYAEDVGVPNGQIYTVRLRADEVFNEMMGSVCGETGYIGLNWTKDVCQLARGSYYAAVKFWTRLQHGPP